MDKKTYTLAALAAALPARALAAPEGGGALPPVMTDMLVMLALVLGVLMLIAVAYIWASLQQAKRDLAQVPKLVAEVRNLTEQVAEISKLLPQNETDAVAVAAMAAAKPAAPPRPAAPVQTMEKKVWQPFVDDYNNLARSMDVPKALEACGKFVQTKQLELLVCLEPAAMEGAVPTPKFAAVDEVAMAAFWAWASPEKDGRYAVVPNLMHPYDQQLHEEGGMKETFASNFEEGVYSSVEVKLPAIFRLRDGKWLIEQPGLIRLQH